MNTNLSSPSLATTPTVAGASASAGTGRHAVALPVVPISGKPSKPGKRVMRGATPKTLEDMPAAVHATDAAAKSNRQTATLRLEVKPAGSEAIAMQPARAERWRPFEVDVGAATARRCTSIDRAAG